MIGTRKLHLMIREELKSHQIKMGRDKLYSLLSDGGFLLRKRQKKIRTTNSSHPFRKYPNLVAGLTISGPNQVWVSDITYWKVKDQFLYITLITDAYSKKVVGYSIASNLEASSSLVALKMALDSAQEPLNNLVHHSDRGIQYCTHEYTRMLTTHGIRISMNQTGDPRENPIAERINGTIKNEYLTLYPVNNFLEAKQLLSSVVARYNCKRPHLSCHLHLPEVVHTSVQPLLGKYNLSTYIRNKSNM